jgi:hypothetical protein
MVSPVILNEHGVNSGESTETKMKMTTTTVSAHQSFESSFHPHRPSKDEMESANPFIGHEILSQSLSQMHAS